MKDRSWLNFFRHSNSLYTRVTRAIVNHVYYKTKVWTDFGKVRVRKEIDSG